MTTNPESFDFNDAKFLQYYYISEKVKVFLTIIKDLTKNISNTKEIPDIKLIILLSGVVFNINDNIYRRSEILINGNKFNSIQLINPTVDLNPISFDSLENLLNFNKVNLIELPNFKKALELLKLFESLLLNSYEILEKKLNVNTIKEKKKHFEYYCETQNEKDNKHVNGEENDGKNGNYNDHAVNKFKMEFNELLLIESLNYKQPLPNIKIINQETIKSYYRINQFNFLKLEINSFNKILKELNFKTLNIDKENIHFRHYMYLNILRIADLYVEIRKIGKVIYLDNIQYFINYAKQDRSIRLTLNSANNIFNNSKLNNMLLTLIMKFSKNNKNISINSISNNQFFNEFKKNIIDSINLLNKMVGILTDLNNHWLKIVKDDKVEEFNKEILREKLRLKTLKDREAKKQLFVENQRLQKNQLNKFKSTSRSNSLNFSNNDFISRHNVRISRSNNSMKENKKEFIEEIQEKNQEESKEADKEVAKQEDEKIYEEVTRQTDKEINREEIKDEIVKNDKSESNEENKNRNNVESKEGSKEKSEEENLENLKNLEKLSVKDFSTESFTKEKSLTKTENSNNNILNGLNRRSSLSISPSRSLSKNSIRNKNALAGAGAANATISKNRINHNDNSIQNNKNNNDHIKAAAALAVKRLPQQNLTAQQRLQQHILKSTKNGSVFGKPLETRRISKIVSKPVITLENKNENQETDQFELEKSPEKALIEFPGSPLNSLKQSSNEAKIALNIQNRSRSNSNISNSSNNTPSPSKYSSPNKNRSRSGSINKMLITKQSGELSRSNSISSSKSKSSVGSRSRSSSTSVTRSRSSSIIGNLNVVLPDDVLIDSNGEPIKKVRFSGIAEYNEDEDAPTPQQMQKQMRQKWAAYKPLFRKLNSQEGLAFKQNRLENEGANGGMSGGLVTGGMNLNGGGLGVNGFLCVPPDSKGKVSMMSVLTGNVEHLDNGNGNKRLSRLFKRR